MTFTVITKRHGVLRVRARSVTHLTRALRAAHIVWLGYVADEEAPEPRRSGPKYPRVAASDLDGPYRDTRRNHAAPLDAYGIASVVGGGLPSLGRR